MKKDSLPQVRGCKLEKVNQKMVEAVAHLIQVKVDQNVPNTGRRIPSDIVLGFTFSGMCFSANCSLRLVSR